MAARRLGVARVEFHEPRGHVAAPRVVREGADQVRPLAGADADRAQRAGRSIVERGPDALLHEGQPPGQPGTRVIVAVMPVVPVFWPGHGPSVFRRQDPGQRGRRRVENRSLQAVQEFGEKLGQLGTFVLAETAGQLTGVSEVLRGAGFEGRFPAGCQSDQPAPSV